MREKDKVNTGPQSIDSGLVHSGPIHGTCVAYKNKGVLVLGASGTGKSALALELMAQGAVLVSDDQTIVDQSQGKLVARTPKALQGLIEARGVGILKAEYTSSVCLQLVVSLDQEEANRLPYAHTITLLGHRLPLLFKVSSPHFSAAILQLLDCGRSA